MPLLPSSADLIQIAAEHICAQHPDPNWQGIAVMTSDSGSVADFLRAWGKNQTQTAKFGLQTFSVQELPLQSDSTQLLGLADLLGSLPNLPALWQSSNTSRMGLARLLLETCQALEAEYGACLEAGEFNALLAESYGNVPPQVYSAQAQGLWQFWSAWQQLKPHTLLENLESWWATHGLTKLYLIGVDTLPRAVRQWCLPRLLSGEIELWLHGRLTGRDGKIIEDYLKNLPEFNLDTQILNSKNEYLKSKLLDILFDDDESQAARHSDLRTRAQDAKTVLNHENPWAHNRLKLVKLKSAEETVSATVLQVQRWWHHHGFRQIAIICPDRKLARQVRAALEQVDMALQDHGGWSLATSTMASGLDAWLACLESDFYYEDLLVLLENRAWLTDNPARHAKMIWHLEHEILKPYQITHNLSKLSKIIARHIEKKNNINAQIDSNTSNDLTWANDCLTIIEKISLSAKNLQQLKQRKTAPTLQKWLETLRESLTQLSFWHSYNQDVAGQKLLEAIYKLHFASVRETITMSWSEFRLLLGHTLENQTFTLRKESRGVRLLNVQQAYLQRWDAAVLCGGHAGNFPSPAKNSIFFSHAVRAELGLPNIRQHEQLEMRRWRLLLEQDAPLCIIEHDTEGDTPLVRSPWLAWLETFYDLLGFGSLDYPRLRLAAQDLENRHAPQIAYALPAPEKRGSIQINASDLPPTLSIRAHQTLINCPYQFFARDILGLQADTDIESEMDAAEYGTLAHECMERFFDPRSGFREVLTSTNLNAALAFFEKITEDVFNHWLGSDEKTWQHEAKRRELMRGVSPVLADFAERHGKNHLRVYAEEKRLHGILDETVALQLRGRADLIEKLPDTNEWVINDYKTGHLPAQNAIESGEDVQLTSYALLSQQTTKLRYVSLRPNSAQSLEAITFPTEKKPSKTESKKPAKEPTKEPITLSDLKAKLQNRLIWLWQAMGNGATLIANGDEKKHCQYCEFKGLCRHHEADADEDDS